jgi:Ca2+-binding EF-hand superfamily protein
LSKAELLDGYKRTMNDTEAEEEVNKIMAVVDKNNSGEIDYSGIKIMRNSEFVAASINR